MKIFGNNTVEKNFIYEKKLSVERFVSFNYTYNKQANQSEIVRNNPKLKKLSDELLNEYLNSARQS